MARRPEPSRHFSLRMAESTLAALEGRARDAGEPRGTLVERYIVQGVRRDEHPGIDLTWTPYGWRARLAGRRLDVHEVIATLKASAGDVDATAAHHEVGRDRVLDCVRYYAAHAAEVDAYAAEVDERARLAHAAWEREQAVIAGMSPAADG